MVKGCLKGGVSGLKKITNSMARVYFNSPPIQELFGIKIKLIGRKKEKKERKRGVSSYNMSVSGLAAGSRVSNIL